MSTTTTHATTSPDGATTATASGTFRLGGDLPVIRLGFGAMRITGPGIWGPPADPDEARAVLRRAVELGVNFIDTADSYGPHVSEELIAEALYPYPDDLVIATKGGLTRQGPNVWTPVARPAYLRQQVEMSLRRLRLDRIDLYQLHRIDPDTPVEDSLGELRALQEEGKIRHIGLSEVSVAELTHARTLVDVVSVQNRYNLVHRTAEDVLDHATRENIAFIPWNPVSTGRLAQPGGVLDTVAKDHVATPVQLALAWLLRRSPAMLPIPGTSSVAHLEENIASAAITLTDEEFADLARLGS
jgi:aryl-alcohol dehydrogenase-like predicted oxidoreductase